MTLSPGMLIHLQAVLQLHKGTCKHCKADTFGILVPLADGQRKWYVADSCGYECFEIHPHQPSEP